MNRKLVKEVKIGSKFTLLRVLENFFKKRGKRELGKKEDCDLRDTHHEKQSLY